MRGFRPLADAALLTLTNRSSPVQRPSSGNALRTVAAPRAQQPSPAAPPAAARPTTTAEQPSAISSWLHDRWVPGQARARIAHFETLKNVGSATAKPLPPQPPMPAPPARVTELPDRPRSAPPLGMAGVFAELVKHPLVRGDSAPETTGTALAVEAGSNQQASVTPSKVSAKDRPLDAFQRGLKERVGMRRRTDAIEVSAEVQRQAEQLRARREAERAAANRVTGHSAGRTHATSGTSASDGFNARRTRTEAETSLVNELKQMQQFRAARLKAAQTG